MKKHTPNPTGRPSKLKNGRDRTIYIDDESWEKAKKLGDGKPSEGIRKALRGASFEEVGEGFDRFINAFPTARDVGKSLENAARGLKK